MTLRQRINLALMVAWFAASVAGLYWSMAVLNNVLVYFLFDISAVHSVWHFSFYYHWYTKWSPERLNQ